MLPLLYLIAARGMYSGINAPMKWNMSQEKSSLSYFGRLYVDGDACDKFHVCEEESLLFQWTKMGEKVCV